MTATEVLNQIDKLPLDEKRQLLAKLEEELKLIKNDLESREKEYIKDFLHKGIISEIPLRLSDDEFRQNFKRINIKGKPLSETIIKERG
jgi:hypothetical protein